MTIRDDVHGVLAGVGTVYPLAVPNSGATYPCIVYQFISEVPMRTHSGASLQKHRVQISCWAKTLAAADTLFQSVNAAMDLNQTNFELATHETTRDEKEVETGLSRVMADYFVWKA